MKLQQLRYLREVVNCGFNITGAAKELYTSQPGISKQLVSLENELAVKIFVRRDRRILGLTATGKEVLRITRRMLHDAEKLGRIKDDLGKCDSGTLIVATTHMHARYILPSVIQRFKARYPGVQVILRQGTQTEVANLVLSGEADIGVTGQPPENHQDLVLLPSHKLPRGVIVPANHPLLAKTSVTLRSIARFPLIMLDPAFSGGQKVIKAFIDSGIRPNVVITAMDDDVIKTYVQLGLGIAILPSIVIGTGDNLLHAIDASHLFEPAVSYIQYCRNADLGNFAMDFMSHFSPTLTPTAIRSKLVS